MPRLPSALPTKLLSEQADRLLGSLFASLPRRSTGVGEVMRMLREDRISRLCLSARKLTALMMIGEYIHPKEVIQAEVRSGIAAMDGEFSSVLSRIMNFDVFGHSFTEKQYGIKGGSCVPIALRTLDPRRYHYEGSLGAIAQVKYRGASGKEATIPYDQGIHLVNDDDLAFDDPCGWGIAETALKFWELEQLVWGCIAIAAQRQATPILALKTDSTAYTLLLGPDGLPVTNPETGEQIQIPLRAAAMGALEEVGNSGAMVLDRLDDLIAVNQQTDGKFFMTLIFQLRQARLESFLVPVTVAGTSQTGVGDSNLGSEHSEFFKNLMRVKAKITCGTLIEKWVKPWLNWNHGDLEDYGKWPIAEAENPQAIELANAISNAISKGGFTPQDEAVIARLDGLLGVSR